jgi:hypothetical protein
VAPNYGALVSSSAGMQGIDQGIDFTASSPFDIYALASGTVTRLVPSGSGWPGAGGAGSGALLVYRLGSGPYAGQNVYVAENFVPAAGLHVHSPVTAGQILGTSPGAYPGIEAGFADAAGHAYGSSTGGPQPQGKTFDSYVQSLSTDASASGSTVDPKQAFVDTLSAASGIDQRVLTAWAQSEGNPGDQPGYYNWLNILSPTAQSLGVTYTPGSHNVAEFGSLPAGVAAAYKELGSLGLSNEQGKTPEQQIQDISQKWEGSPSPAYQSLLTGVFTGKYGSSALTSSDQIATPSQAELTAAGVGSGGSPLGQLAGDAAASAGDVVSGAVKPITDALSSVENALSFVFSIRFLEIVAGGALMIVAIVAMLRGTGAQTVAVNFVDEARGKK